MIDVNEALRVKDNFAKYNHIKSNLIKGDPTKTAEVSICIPTYKRVDTLRETIESCLNQVDFDDYLIIVSDNNPERNDETEQYMSTLLSDKILYYKHEENIGMYGNLNRIYQLSKSEYTVCVHDDDILCPHFLTICYGIIFDNASIDFLYPNKINWKEGEARPNEFINRSAYLYKMKTIDLVNDNPCPPTGLICRTASALKSGGFEYNTYPSNDYYFNVKLVYNNFNIYRLEQELYIYRWAQNTSLKKETIEGFMFIDPPLMKWQASKIFKNELFYKLILNGYRIYWLRFFYRLYPDQSPKNISQDIKLKIEKSDIIINRFFTRIMNIAKKCSHILYGHKLYF